MEGGFSCCRFHKTWSRRTSWCMYGYFGAAHPPSICIYCMVHNHREKEPGKQFEGKCVLCGFGMLEILNALFCSL